MSALSTIDPSLEIQGAIVAVLKGDDVMRGLIGERVFDDVPRDPMSGDVTAAFPYISFGREQVVPVDVDCIPGSEIYIDLDIWSREEGFVEVKKIAWRMRKLLHDRDLGIEEAGLVSIAYDGRRLLRDPDGITRHGVVTFRAIVEHD
jgi:hypothetical protein